MSITGSIQRSLQRQADKSAAAQSKADAKALSRTLDNHLADGKVIYLRGRGLGKKLSSRSGGWLRRRIDGKGKAESKQDAKCRFFSLGFQHQNSQNPDVAAAAQLLLNLTGGLTSEIKNTAELRHAVRTIAHPPTHHSLPVAVHAAQALGNDIVKAFAAMPARATQPILDQQAKQAPAATVTAKNGSADLPEAAALIKFSLNLKQNRLLSEVELRHGNTMVAFQNRASAEAAAKYEEAWDSKVRLNGSRRSAGDDAPIDRHLEALLGMTPEQFNGDRRDAALSYLGDLLSETPFLGMAERGMGQKLIETYVQWEAERLQTAQSVPDAPKAPADANDFAVIDKLLSGVR